MKGRQARQVDRGRFGRFGSVEKKKKIPTYIYKIEIQKKQQAQQTDKQQQQQQQYNPITEPLQCQFNAGADCAPASFRFLVKKRLKKRPKCWCFDLSVTLVKRTYTQTHTYTDKATDTGTNFWIVYTYRK